MMNISRVLLTILDGAGLRDEVKGNAFKQAKKANFDYLWNNYPHTELLASGQDVGLPKGQMGNSETGHLNIGAGRIVYQPLELINKSIDDRSFYENEVLLDVMKYAKNNSKKLHFIGLISDGGVHSHINHLKNLLKMAKSNNVEEIYMHLITDGRDTLMDSGYKYVSEIEKLDIGSVATICGRYYTMDRDKNYDRTLKGYKLMTEGISKEYKNSKDVFDDSYKNGIYDEFIEPSLLNKNGLIEKEDAVIWFNFRPDRAIQILSYLENITSHIATMMFVSNDIKAPFAFKLNDLKNTFGEYISDMGLKQLRIAETEKYAHVTYFFDGGVEKKLNGCDRILVHSPKVATYDLKPEMSAYEVTDKLLENMNKYDVIILNFANPDMVGHTGNMSATIKAVEVVDENLGRIYEKACELGFTLLVTADHGNSEYMIDENNNPVTSHTTNKVPFIVCNKNLQLNEGRLSDIAPTMLELLRLGKPKEMTGESLIK